MSQRKKRSEKRQPPLKPPNAPAPKEEKEEMDDKAKKGFWPCQSYKCTKSGSNHMNPKYAEKCTRCGAMKPLGAGSDVFNHGMSEKAYLQNQSKYR